MSPLPLSWSGCARPRATISPSLRRWLGLFLLVMTVGLAGTYLITTNVVATKGYEIQGLKTQLEKLRQDSQKLEVEVTRLQALANIEQALPSNTFVAVEKIEYLQAVLPGDGVAVR